MKILKIGVVVLGIATLALVAVACGGTSSKISDPQTRVIYMSAVEWKGTTSVDKEHFPDEALPEGGGYKLVPPDDKGEWKAQTYRWDLGTIVVNQGDTVVLKIFGVNGSLHPSVIEGYDVTFEVTRGHLTTVEFRADKAGTFHISCGAHQPSMTAELIVLPR